GNQASQKERVVTTAEAEALGDERRRAIRGRRHAIRDVVGDATVASEVEVREILRHRDGGVRHMGADPSGAAKRGARSDPPLVSLVIEAVNRQDDTTSGQHSRQRREDRGTDRVVVEDVGAPSPREHCDRRRKAAVDEGLEVLGGGGGNVSHVHPAVLGDVGRGVVGPREHSDVVPALNQARPHLLDVVLDAPDRCRNATLPDEGDANRLHAARGRTALVAWAYMAPIRSRCRSGEHSATIVSRALSRIANPRPGSLMYGRNDAASALGSLGGTRSPVFPGSMSSGMPPRSLPMTGTPLASASSTTIG